MCAAVCSRQLIPSIPSSLPLPVPVPQVTASPSPTRMRGVPNDVIYATAGLRV